MKVSAFNVYATSLIEGTKLMYNTLSGSFLSLPDRDFDSAVDVLAAVEDGLWRPGVFDPAIERKLAEGGFVLDSAVDERAVVRSRYWGKDEASRAALSLTIAPTVSCNFGCTYCFQEHPNRKMSAEDVQAIKRYVAENIGTADGLYVTWFGGEPLVAFSVIRELNEYFTETCGQAGKKYEQSMITNGMLLRDQRLEYFRAQDNVSYIQITLDGPPQAHDLRRLQVDGRPTFCKILANVKAAADDLPISIRVNVDKTNVEALEELIEILEVEGLRGRVSVYLGHVLPYTEVCADVNDVAFTIEEFAAIEANFNLILLERGFRPNASLPRPQGGNLCVADHPKGAVLAPGNLVFRCWNEVAELADKASGSLEGSQITSTNQQQGTRQRWDDYDPFSHQECQQCIVQPLCKGGCPWEARKNPTAATGHCTTLRYNLVDRLRIHHLMRSIDAHPALEAMELPPPMGASERCS
jgi:uncharacterized protein